MNHEIFGMGMMESKDFPIMDKHVGKVDAQSAESQVVRKNARARYRALRREEFLAKKRGNRYML